MLVRVQVPPSAPLLVDISFKSGSIWLTPCCLIPIIRPQILSCLLVARFVSSMSKGRIACGTGDLKLLSHGSGLLLRGGAVW